MFKVNAIGVVLVSLLLTLDSVSNVNFEHVTTGWVSRLFKFRRLPTIVDKIYETMSEIKQNCTGREKFDVCF